MPYGQPAQLANLKPAWPKGHKPNTTRRSRDVDKTLCILRKAAPEAADLLASIMRDPKQPTKYRLEAAVIILKYSMPKNAAEIIFGTGTAEPRLEVRFVEGGIEYSRDEWQARGTKIVDQQSVNEPRLPPLRIVWDAEPVAPLRPPRQDAPGGAEKVPSLRARAAAGIFASDRASSRK
jgi:hypothetical protein